MLPVHEDKIKVMHTVTSPDSVWNPPVEPEADYIVLLVFQISSGAGCVSSEGTLLSLSCQSTLCKALFFYVKLESHSDNQILMVLVALRPWSLALQ